MNKSIVTFTRGTLAQATPLWQYDYGQVLEINGLELPTTYQVHFCNCSDTQTITVLGNADGVLIPDNLLQTGKTVIAYIYLHTGADDGETEYKITIPVRPRPAPSDIPPTPEQQSALDEAIAALNSAVEDVEDIADGIPDQIDTALAEAKASGEFDGPPGSQGPKGDDYVLTAADRAEIAGIASDDVLIVSDEEPTTEPLPKIWIDSDDDGTILIPTMEDIGDLSDLVTTAKDNLVAAINEAAQSGGGGGTSDYSALTNKPQINGTTLSGNKSASDLGLAPAGAYVKPSGGIPASDLASGVIPTVPVQSVNGKTGAVVLDAADVGAGTYSKPSGGIPKTDLASAVQTSLGKADTALQQHQSLAAYRTAAAQDLIDQEQDAAISGKLDSTGDAYRAASIPMGQLDSTSTATVMTAQVPGITELRDGVCVWLTNGVIASAAGVTLNINNLGAKPIYNSLAGTSVTTTFAKAATYLFVYNSTRVTGGCWDMVYGYDTNTTYTPAKLGFGYATCSTAAATVAKTAALSSYTLTTGGIVAVKFTNAVPAGATLNINSKGAKAIYYKGAAITAGVIKAGDTVTMIYSTYYHVLSIDRPIPLPSDATPETVSTYSGSAGTSEDYARADHVHYISTTDIFENAAPVVDKLILPSGATNGATVILMVEHTGEGYLLYDFLSARNHIAYFLIPLVQNPQDLNDFQVVSDASVSKAYATANGLGLQFNGIADGKLYSAEFVLPFDSKQATGTLSVTDLTLPSAQGVSF